ncbi:ArsO family NAD(P)H-dependent flavin-containing monooxygenase [Maribacter ulvicola]|uniref:Pyridine nucleotide-disulphide oxidoreductase n=1 Tax=Maribacter ulvicola TaxID=228959 RepID=A0A1N6ZYV3_9FLAO|nr:ArsO family NAD(P)H-dependent flavin-containing monooxygenase [Maribacter ulvicola]SIR31936.1 Pyridine nucleotide-disulphide oxidoreductase [Maribacter ulvicola]
MVIPENIYDCIIIGGGQAGLSVAYFLKRSKLNYLILDVESNTGGSWLHTWDSLKLFSPSQYSSLSGWQMPTTKQEYPTKYEYLNYLSNYEKRYNFPIQRNTFVEEVVKEKELFKLKTNRGDFVSKTVVSATGTARSPFIPDYPYIEHYLGVQIHSSSYKNNSEFEHKRVLVVGGGNSGAQILAEVSKVAYTKWVTLEKPVFLPEEIDGRYLFNQANKKYFNQPNASDPLQVSLSDIVQVESVKEGLIRGVFKDNRPFTSFYENGVVWQDGKKEVFDAIIWCTGFKPHLNHLNSLNIVENNKVATNHTRAIKEPNLWVVGYGNWTGFASATIYGVGKTAKHTAKEIISTLS